MNIKLGLVVLLALAFARVQPLAAERDAHIETALNNSYAYRVYLKDAAIKVESREGVVTLAGQVDELSQKHLAQEAAAGIPGVVRVDNKLEIKLEGTEKSDSWIRSKVRSVLTLHRNVSGNSTQVDIRDGVITLRGPAASEAQKELSGEYAEDVSGVLRVINLMEVVAPEKVVRPAVESVDDASITAQVRVALQFHRSTSAVRTRVETLHGVVSVSGVAKNLAEKALVTKLASDIIGVRSVDNRMTVDPNVSSSGVKPAPPGGVRIGIAE